MHWTSRKHAFSFAFSFSFTLSFAFRTALSFTFAAFAMIKVGTDGYDGIEATSQGKFLHPFP